MRRREVAALGSVRSKQMFSNMHISRVLHQLLHGVKQVEPCHSQMLVEGRHINGKVKVVSDFEYGISTKLVRLG